MRLTELLTSIADRAADSIEICDKVKDVYMDRPDEFIAIEGLKKQLFGVQALTHELREIFGRYGKE